MSSLLFQDIIKIGAHQVVVLCRAATSSGERFFHYIQTDKRNIELMHRDYNEQREVDFSSYGEIIHSGWGENPTQEDERAMRDSFSCHSDEK